MNDVHSLERIIDILIPEKALFIVAVELNKLNYVEDAEMTE